MSFVRGAGVSSRWSVEISSLLLACAASLAVAACKKDEPPPPLPIEQPVAKPPEAPLELKPEDAGVPPKPEEKPKATGTKAPSSSLTNCCAALKQNAASAPEPTRTYMLQGAATCDALAAQGKDKASFVGVLSGMLKGAGVPVACK